MTGKPKNPARARVDIMNLTPRGTAELTKSAKTNKMFGRPSAADIYGPKLKAFDEKQASASSRMRSPRSRSAKRCTGMTWGRRSKRDTCTSRSASWIACG
jgi:hypothetical protein